MGATKYRNSTEGKLMPQDKSVGTSDCLNNSLKVPAGKEFVFAIHDAMTTALQQTSFDIIDIAGNPLCGIHVTEKSRDDCGIWIRFVNNEPLAYIDTSMYHKGTAPIAGRLCPNICHPDGEPFCSVTREESDGNVGGRFVLKGADGSKTLATFEGDYANKAINGRGPNGNLICATRRCSTLPSHYEVRVASHADAGLMLCGLLAISKM